MKRSHGLSLATAIAIAALAGYQLWAQEMPLTGTCYHSTVGTVVGKTIQQGPGGFQCQGMGEVESVTLWVDVYNRQMPLVCRGNEADVCWCIDEVAVGSFLEARGPVRMDGDMPVLLVHRD